MRKFAALMAAILFLSLVVMPVMAQEDMTTNDNEMPDPTEPLLDVEPDKLIKPETGLGSIKYGDTLQQVEDVFGRGDIKPEEPDFKGNNIVNLIYAEKGLVFKFFNGKLAMVVIDKPGYATKEGVQVGGDIGDLIREFGTDYVMTKSLMPEEGMNNPDYEIMFKNIAATVKGKLILKLRIKTNS